MLLLTVLNAVGTSQSKGFVASKEDGYKTNVAQDGTSFFGGQRQRLSIARVLVKNAPIYLFDDSFSALGLKIDAQLRATLKNKISGYTMIMVVAFIAAMFSTVFSVVGPRLLGCVTTALVDGILAHIFGAGLLTNFGHNSEADARKNSVNPIMNCDLSRGEPCF